MRKPDRSWAKDDKGKAEVFAAHLEQTFQPTGERILTTSPQSEEKLIQRITLVTPKEVLQTIRAHTKSKKVPGFDLTLRRLMSYMEHPFLMFLDHTQRRSTVGRTPLDE